MQREDKGYKKGKMTGCGKTEVIYSSFGGWGGLPGGSDFETGVAGKKTWSVFKKYLLSE